MNILLVELIEPNKIVQVRQYEANCPRVVGSERFLIDLFNEGWRVLNKIEINKKIYLFLTKSVKTTLLG